MPPRHWHRRSWEVGLTTATVYYMVSARTSCDVCRVYRMRRQDSSLVQENTITSLLCWTNLHWLPLRQRIIFKIATLMHQCLTVWHQSSLVTSATKDNLQDRHFDAPMFERFGTLLPTWRLTVSKSRRWTGRRQLRSAASGQLYIPRTKTMTFGPRSFKISGPTIWNDLPAGRLKDSSLSKNSFRKLLETFLFDRWPLHLFTAFAVYINLRGEMFVMNEWMNEPKLLKLETALHFPWSFVISLSPHDPSGSSHIDGFANQMETELTSILDEVAPHRL